MLTRHPETGGPNQRWNVTEALVNEHSRTMGCDHHFTLPLSSLLMELLRRASLAWCSMSFLGGAALPTPSSFSVVSTDVANFKTINRKKTGNSQRRERRRPFSRRLAQRTLAETGYAARIKVKQHTSIMGSIQLEDLHDLSLLQSFRSHFLNSVSSNAFSCSLFFSVLYFKVP